MVKEQRRVATESFKSLITNKVVATKVTLNFYKYNIALNKIFINEPLA